MKVLNKAILRIADISKTNSKAGAKLQVESRNLQQAASKLSAIFNNTNISEIQPAAEEILVTEKPVDLSEAKKEGSTKALCNSATESC